MKRIYALILVLVSVSTALCQTSYDYGHNNWVYLEKYNNFSALTDSDFMLFRSFESISEVLNKRYYLKNREGKPTAKPIILHDKRVKDDELVVVQYAEAKPRKENANGAKTIKIDYYKVGSDTPHTSKTYYSVAELNSDNDWISEKAYSSIFPVRNWLFENVAESNIYHDLTIRTDYGYRVYGQGFFITIVFTNKKYTPLPERIRAQLLFY